jgi:hypothetical protein
MSDGRAAFDPEGRLDTSKFRETLTMRRVFLAFGLLALLHSHAFAQSPAPAKSPSTINPTLIASILHVKTDHLRISGSDAAPDVWYEVNACSLSGPAARKDFQRNLVALLPVLLAKDPDMRNIFIRGGCMMVDVYGRESFDENAINAMFSRENLDKVVWDKVTPENLFNSVAHGRWMNPDMRP